MSEPIDIPPGAHFILADPNGDTFVNQAGGYACRQPTIVGRRLTIQFALPNGLSDTLCDYFTGAKHGGWCDNGIDLDDAEWLDARLIPFRLIVDRDRLKDSMEAWIYVKVWGSGDAGVLAWENSD